MRSRWLSWLLLATLCGLPRLARADSLGSAQNALAHGSYELALKLLAPGVKKQQPRALALTGRVHRLRGERDAARRSFESVIALYNRGAIDEHDGKALWAVAEATEALGAFRDANETFARAVEAAPDELDIQLDWSELFLAKHALREAETGVAQVLSRAPEHARALAQKARIELERGADFAAVESLLARALQRDPQQTAAYVTRAGIALRDEDLALADRHLDAALAVNPRDLTALSVRAAVRFVANDDAGFARAIAAVLRENPRFSRAYSIVATYAEWEHRYPELVALSEAALRIDPDDATAHAARGLNLLRIGREDEGLVSLRAAWALDHYDTQVFNLLELYEKALKTDYESFDAPHFRLRMQQKERELLEPYAVPLLEQAYDTLVKRYAFRPSEPTHVELYASPEHFSIRATGMPRLGVQGICFGNVLIALSPRGGEFNWAQILWHELSHVFHVQLSHGRVPRWFTEGLAEYETELARPEWKREDDRPLYDALVRGDLPALSELNHAFTHARKPEELMVAYYASALAVRFLAENYGQPAIVAMLSSWGQGLATSDVFERAIKTSLSAVDAAFRAQLSTRLRARYAHDLRIDMAAYQDLGLWRKRSAARGATAEDHAGLALALAQAGEIDAARARATALLQDVPGQPLARFTLAHLALERGELREAKRELDLLLAAGSDGYQLRMLRARIAKASGDLAAVVPELETAIRIDAERAEAYTMLSDVAQQLGDTARLESSLRKLSALDQHSRGPLRRLLAVLRARSAGVELVEVARAGLYRDVEDGVIHLALAEGLMSTERLVEAHVEAERARTLASPADRTQATQLLRAIEAKQRAARAPARIDAKPQKAR